MSKNSELNKTKDTLYKMLAHESVEIDDQDDAITQAIAYIEELETLKITHNVL